MWVDDSDIDSISRYLEMDRDEFSARYLRRVGWLLSLKDNPDQDCIFWKDGCTIYPVRPPQCRTFPFWPDSLDNPEAWRTVGRSCPGVGQGRSYDLVRIGELQRGVGETGPTGQQ